LKADRVFLLGTGCFNPKKNKIMYTILNWQVA